MIWERASGRPIHPAIVWQDRRSPAACEALAAAGHEPLVRESHRPRARRHVPGQQDPLAARPRAGRRAGGRGRGARLRRCRIVARVLADGRRDARDRRRQRRAHDALRARRHGLGRRAARPVRRARVAPAADRRLRRRLRRDARPAAARGRARRPAGIALRAALLRARAGQGHARHRRLPARPGRQRSRRAPPDGVLASPAWRREGVTSYALEGFVPVAGRGDRLAGRDRGARAAAALDALDRDRRPPTSSEVVFVPALQGLGTPSWRADARGTLVGAEPRRRHGPRSSRATVDGVLHQIVDGVDAIARATPIEAIRLDGGLSRSAYVVQRLADLSGLPIERAARSDSTAVGAALLGGLRRGLWQGLAALPPAASRPAGRAAALRRAAAARSRPLRGGDGARRAVRAARARRLGSARGCRRVPVWDCERESGMRRIRAFTVRLGLHARRAPSRRAARAPRAGRRSRETASTTSMRPRRRSAERQLVVGLDVPIAPRNATRSRRPRSRARSPTACRTPSPCPRSPTGRGSTRIPSC